MLDTILAIILVLLIFLVLPLILFLILVKQIKKRRILEKQGLELYSKRTILIAKIITIVGIINFISFIVRYEYFGGSAVKGYAKDGHYFLSPHGQTFIETSKAIWLFSYYHEISMYITYFLAFLVGVTILKERR